MLIIGQLQFSRKARKEKQKAKTARDKDQRKEE
jgi:hypothetical protein